MTPGLTLTHSFPRNFLTKIVHISEISWRTPIYLLFCQKLHLIKAVSFWELLLVSTSWGAPYFLNKIRKIGEMSESSKRGGITQKKRVKEIVIIIKCLYCRHSCRNVTDPLLLSHSQPHHPEKKSEVTGLSPPKEHNSHTRICNISLFKGNIWLHRKYCSYGPLHLRIHRGLWSCWQVWILGTLFI